jgi:biotin-dependent carboxylase-like uncharacterized protein
MRTCEVVKPGILSLVQDLGRRGYYSMGIPDGQVYDSVAFRMGNLLLENSLNAAGIEILWGRLQLEFLEKTWIAITGGDLGAKIDDKPVPMWQTLLVNKGQRLSFSGRRSGLRAYLLLAGGLEVPEFLGSRSTHPFLRRGGFEGRSLQEGDVLKTFPKPGQIRLRRVREQLRPIYDTSPQCLRMIYGLQYKLLTESSLKCFESETWRVTPEASRMGIRLKGPALEFKQRSNPLLDKTGGTNPSNIPSEGYPLGSIQYPGEGQLIIIGPDGPCEGGYAKLGTIISADFYLLGQIMPGDKIRFESVNLDEAYKELHRQKSICEGYETLEDCL